jgi:hypothetical protein
MTPEETRRVDDAVNSLTGGDGPIRYVSSTDSDRIGTICIGYRNDANVYDVLAMLSNRVCECLASEASEPDVDVTPKKVFVSGPVVGVIWSDGKKTMTRCHEDDKFSLNFGLMNNYLRKVTNNRGKYDTKWDDAACGAVAIAEMLGTPDDMRAAAKMLEFLADASEIFGGAE